jgi:diacylglycerol kinase family enzyme
MRVAILANPISGSRRNHEHVAALQRELESRAAHVRVCWKSEELEAVLQLPAAADPIDVIIAAGGDGTVSRLINLRPAAPIAHFPLGTENLFAQAFGYSSDPRSFAQQVLNSRARTIDLAQATFAADERNTQRQSMRASLMISAGFDAAVTHRLHEWRSAAGARRRVSRASYIRPIVSCAITFKHPMMTLRADNRRIRARQILIFNISRYFSGLNFAPDAIADDGELDWVAYERGGPLRHLLHTMAVRRGKHLQRADVHSGRAKSLIIDAETPVPVQIDGEAAGFTPCEVGVLPAAISVCIADWDSVTDDDGGRL